MTESSSLYLKFLSLIHSSHTDTDTVNQNQNQNQNSNTAATTATTIADINEISFLLSFDELPLELIQQLQLNGTGTDDTHDENSKRLPFLLINKTVGILYECIPVIYRYGQHIFNQSKQQLHTLQQTQQQQEVSSITSLPSSLMQASLSTILQRINDGTHVMLLLNADYHTAWNIRYCMLLHQYHYITYRDELKFTRLVLSKHYKSGETWCHYRHVLFDYHPLFSIEQHHDTHVNAITINPHDVSDIIRNEFALCTSTAEQHPRNYYSWNHRLLLVKRLIQSHVTEKSDDNTATDHTLTDEIIQLIIDDFVTVSQWCNTHISDYSAYHYIHQVYDILASHSCFLYIDTQWVRKAYVGSMSTTAKTIDATFHSITSELNTSSFLPIDPIIKAAINTLIQPRINHYAQCVPCQLLCTSLQQCIELLHSFPKHESLWLHYQHLLFIGIQLFLLNDDDDDDAMTMLQQQVSALKSINIYVNQNIVSDESGNAADMTIYNSMAYRHSVIHNIRFILMFMPIMKEDDKEGMYNELKHDVQQAVDANVHNGFMRLLESKLHIGDKS